MMKVTIYTSPGGDALGSTVVMPDGTELQGVMRVNFDPLAPGGRVCAQITFEAEYEVIAAGGKNDKRGAAQKQTWDRHGLPPERT